MATAEYKITNFTVDDPATIKAKLDANSAVVTRTAAGFQCYASTPTGMTVRVAAGALFVASALVENAIQVSGALVAPVVNPRIDRVVIDQLSGVASIIGGVEAAVPVAPALPAGKLPIAEISLAVGLVAITNALITDKRAAICQIPLGILAQNSQSANYTAAMGDAGRHILHPLADNNPRTFTIDSNANVAYPIGTAITFVNEINALTIAITADTLTLAGAGTVGARTLAANGIATALKIGATKWIISGTGLT